MNTVYKILPVSLFDIPGMEQWLDEQANLGLSPTHLGSYAAFTRNGVPGTRYRLESWGKMGTEPDPEQLELYRNAGWEYAFPLLAPTSSFTPQTRAPRNCIQTLPPTASLWTDWRGGSRKPE